MRINSKQIENGVVVSTEGSWEAGVDGATPGIIMLAEPKIGTQYQQEFAEGVAEDMAKVLSLSETVEVPYGRFEVCLQTAEWTPLAPGAREFKYYAPGESAWCWKFNPGAAASESSWWRLQTSLAAVASVRHHKANALFLSSYVINIKIPMLLQRD